MVNDTVSADASVLPASGKPNREGRVRAAISRWGPSGAVLVFSVALLATDTPMVGWSGFWAEHTLIAGALMGGVTIAIGILMVDRYLKKREREQWEHVARLAFQDLAREVMLIVRMNAEITGEADYRNRAARPLRPADAEVAHHVLDATLGPIQERIKTERRVRLKRLFENSEWGVLSYQVMQNRIHEGRLTISRWAPVMVTNEPLAQVLTGVAKVVRDIEIIQSLLVQVHVDGQEVDPAQIAEWVDLWDPFEEQCRAQHAELVPSAYMYRVHRTLAG